MRVYLVIICIQALDLYNYQNLQHYGFVYIGGQEIPVMFDTGSTRTWIASINCYSKGCNKHVKYDPYVSKSFKALHSSFEIEYGTGGIRGDLCTDTLKFDGFEVKNVEIGLVDLEIGQVFEKIPFAGIIGISPHIYPSSFLYEIYSQLNISTLLISLSENSYDLGFISFTETIGKNMEKSQSLDYWEIPLSEFYIGDFDLCKESCNAVIDTGTSVISLPSPVHFALRKSYNLQKNCENAENFPNMQIGIQKKTYEIPAFEFIAFDQGECSLALMKLDIPEPVGPFFILGGTFLRQVFLYLDIVNLEVGIVGKTGVFVKNKLIKI